MAYNIFLLALAGTLMATTLGVPTPTGEAEAATAEPGCRRITAGLRWGDHNFLFFGNDVIFLDEGLNEIRQGESYYEFGAPYPEAAFIFTLDGSAYFFSDKYYFSHWTNYSPVDAEVFGGRTHGEFFKNGLDAAGNLNGMTVFIKGCQYVVSLPNAPSDPAPLPEGIPCPLDAALSVGDDLWLFKDDKLWKMTPTGVAPGMPIQTSSVINLKNIRLCAEGEKEE